MTSAQGIEAQARLNVCLHEIVGFFEAAGVQSHSLNLLNEYVEKHMTLEFLDLAEAFGKCNAFINHDLLMNLLHSAWNALSDGCCIERKILNKKIKALKEDKKADQDLLNRQEVLLAELEQKKAEILLNLMRLRTMVSIPLEAFKKDVNFDALKQYNDKKKRVRDLLAAGKQKSS